MELKFTEQAKIDLASSKFIQGIKLILIVLLASVEIAVIATAVGYYVDVRSVLRLTTVIVCCVALAFLVTLDAYVVKNFSAKMSCYGVDTALLLIICIMTGNSFLAILYCIVLTQIYMTIDKFRDKAILFGISCGTFVTSFIIGWVFANEGASIYNSVVEILTGAVFGLLAMLIDFIVVQFLLGFYKQNKELSAALKEADESKAQLKEAYEELSRTAVFEERNRIAKDIHDNAGHSMTTVIMQTEAAKLLFDKDPEEAKNRIIAANIQARNALEQMRESVHLLAGRDVERPLKQALEEIVSQSIDGTDIKVRYDFDDLQADPEVERLLCNSLKECISNGIRHGGATAFYAELKRTENRVRFFVSDNGSGASGEVKQGFGLKSMKDKAEEYGGVLRAEGEEGEGFEVELTLPGGIFKGERAQS